MRQRLSTRTGIVLATLTLVAILCGRGTSWLVAGALFDAPMHAATPDAPVANTRGTPPDPCALLRDDALFDSGLVLACEVPPAGPRPPAHEGAAGASCDGALRLVGTVVPRDATSEAFAAVVDATGSSLLYTERMRIGDRTLVEIARDTVELESADGSRCLLTLFERAGPPIATLGTPPVLDDEIRATGPTSFRVTRRLVDGLVSSGELLTTLHAIPHEDAQGAPDGARIFGVRAGSVAARLGVANGDVITSVNGRSLADVAVAIDAFAELRAASRVTLRGSRRGEPLELAYDIE